MTSAMALTEEEVLSVMLQTNHPSQGHMSMSLSNAMISSNAMDLLSGQLPYSPLQSAQSIDGPGSMNMNMNMSMQGGGLERSSMSSMGSLGSGGISSMSQASQWPFTNDEKWELDGKNEVLDSAAMRSNVANFGGRMEAPLQPLNQLSRTQGLQRYHSAPSSFLQCLAEVNEEAFSHINSPGSLVNSNESGRDDHLKFFNENLAPIMESAPSRWTKQPDSEKVVARSNPMNSTEQYFAIQAEKTRQAALRESSVPSENMKSLSRSTQRLGPPGLRGGASGASDFHSRTLNSSLLRQSSSPAELLAALNEREEDFTATMQQQIRSQDDSLSGVTFGENRSNKQSIASMYSNTMCVFNDAMTGSGGVWKAPISPAGNLAGKRVRFPEEMTDDLDLLGEDGCQQNFRGGRSGSLMRHQSLPSNSTLLDPSGVDMGYDDLLDLYSPCKTRARRGYATHPRSIAERNRRSRISERMKKLQDLVPNMDKQTNTADMLDEAVEYVKHLQLQVKDLSATIVQLKNGIRQQNAG